ncbi:saccharopine dehydrogenase NADP-binding domain-containing protein [Antrihabitans cavernicola]|uniref:Saccharopine dehydrogenase NADP binding domain-containing protein n=1 Tax=Antrihabitans cavernicola TaxID=2495913 RepID=A0A5A7S672_9NOCA|nr:saccharopine dehydrogenase NADP-binding domain-containing protein [Spelaeibacter cavernicola]KAA0018920.1 hypothetical protein FOY51_23050 [Spelaeibacter cavernicola]
MFTNNDWLLYGATGRTGTLIAEHAVALGHRPLLAGRDASRLRPLAQRLDLPWIETDVDELDRHLGDSRLVLLTAGPFASTSQPVLAACLRAGVHYLDIANEIDVVDRVLRTSTSTITAIPAVGFGTVATDGIASWVAAQVPGADRLELLAMPSTAGSSAGAQASTMLALAGGGRVLRDGALVRTGLGSSAHRMQTPLGTRTAVPVPTGDLVVSHRTTGIPNITAHTAMTLHPLVARTALPVLPTLAKAARHLPRNARPAPDGPTTYVAGYVWARATARDGRSAEGWLRTGEGYAYTAATAVATVEAVLATEPLGATTVTAAFGTEIAFGAGGEIVAAA